MDILNRGNDENGHPRLGAVALSPEILGKANIGLWAFEMDEGSEPRMYANETMLGLLGLKEQIPPEEIYHAWYDHIDESCYGLVNEAVDKMMHGEHAEVQYPWNCPDGKTIIVRCGGVRNPEYTQGIRIEGTHQDVTEVVHFDEEEAERFKNADIKLQHEQLRAQVLNYMIDHEDDPIELLKIFAERLRVLLDCDQVVYRDLEETRIMVNSPDIEETWHVPIEFCMQCEHFDALHPMYDGGYTEMSNCQEGWQGIPVYHECPIKSSLTRIVYCDGEAAGYLAIHYVQKYHTFTDIERYTLEEFTRILSISLSRYESKLKSRELEDVRRRMNMIYALSDVYDPILLFDPESGEYNWYMGKAHEVEETTFMNLHGDDIYTNISIDVASVIHEEDREAFRSFYSKENMMKVARTGEGQVFEARWLWDRDNEVYLWKYNKVERMIDENGRVFIVVGIVDTTEEKEREAVYEAQNEVLVQQSAFNDYFLESYSSAYYANYRTGEAIVIKRPDHSLNSGTLIENSYEVLNKFMEATVTAEERESLGKLIQPDNLEKLLEDQSEYSYIFRDKLGESERIMCCRIFRVQEKDHVAVGFIDMTNEFAEEQKRQNQLEEALSMAQSANIAKTAFLSNMSHDIRTPMNAIIGYTGLATSHIDNKAQVLDYLSKINQSSTHLLSLINDVLDMSRIESGKMTLDEKDEKVSDIVNTIMNIVQANVAAKKLSLSINTDDVFDDDIVCDKLRVNQVLLNVISNAVKYTPAEGEITMTVSEKRVKKSGYGAYEFVIKDNGNGMDEDFLSTIFDPFTRERTSTVSGIQGTGLGMAITKNIVDIMGGKIDIKSEIGRGTEVTILFDFKLSIGQNAAGEATSLTNISFTGRKVLLVEDNELNREIATELLEEEGFVVDTAEDGDIAVVRMMSAKPGDYDIVLMDVQMPRMDGYEATRQIRALGTEISTIPILAMTANAFEEDRKHALEAGMDEHISKPINIDNLKETMAKFL